jgi:septum formation topological specificity factor MinE
VLHALPVRVEPVETLSRSRANEESTLQKVLNMRTNYVLIDYENVQPEKLSALVAEHFKVLVFIGANQSKISFETAAAIQQMGSQAEYIKISGNGSNALDFHIAFYIGQIAAKDATAFFHIVSKDTGFDPLIQHLKQRKIFAARSRDVSSIPIVKSASARTKPDRLALVIANLQQRGASKPRVIKTLRNTLAGVFQKQITEPELDDLLANLQAKGYVTLDGTRVSYSLPQS